jgi:hypothetical protein
MIVAGIFLYSMWNSCMQAVAGSNGRCVPNNCCPF